jgi:hypothetical protein
LKGDWTSSEIGTALTQSFDEQDPELALMLGGPLYQLYVRARLLKPPLDLVLRRIAGVCLICWLPLLLLSMGADNAIRGVSVPFLLDAAVHVRFLIVVPLLIWAERFVHQRLRQIPRQFLARGIIATTDRTRFKELVSRMMHLRNSVIIEILLLLLVFTVPWLWTANMVMGTTTWYGFKIGEHLYFTKAGYWYALVSLPIFRFILVRWYFRLFVWYCFLWRIRKFPLHFNLFHPDRAGGIGFLASSVAAFTPVLIAQTTLLSGLIINRIWYVGASLLTFKMEIVIIVIFLMLLPLAPLTFFVIQLDRASRKARREYGILASRYVEEFYQKWTDRHSNQRDKLLGSSDIQSLADLGNSFNTINTMRRVPFGKETIVRLAFIVAAPFLPLTLTMIPLEQVLERVIKLVF